MHPTLHKVLTHVSKPHIAIGGAVIIAALILGAAWYLTAVSPTGAYTAAVLAPITEQVNVSGPVQGAETTDLSFQIPGQVASIPVNVGDHVYAGETLVALSGGAQAASLLGAQANLATASATLASLTAGTRPEQLTIDQNNVTQSQAAVANAIRSAYVAADTAVHAEADQFFSNPRTPNAQLTFIVPDTALVNRLQLERVALEPMLTSWGASLDASAGSSVDATVAGQNLAQVASFLDDAARALGETSASSALPLATLNAYQSAISGARSSVAGAATALTAAQSALTASTGALTLAEAGPTPQALAVAEAQVSAAQAAVDSAGVNSNETVIVAPISGVITAQNAHLGETVAPGVPMVSMISSGAFEAKAPVSESDIGKIKVGDAVNATFDAYPTVTFPATVTAVDPAATIMNGVATYQVTVTFTAADPRIESGLTAHLAITTATVPNALTVPASAIITNGTTQFVYLKGASTPTQVPVTTGIESSTGMVQILSGLSAGQQVLTFGNAQ